MSFLDHLALADRAAREHLGGSVTYAPGTGSPVTVNGVFDALYEHVDAGQAGVSTFSPAVFLALSDLPSDPRADKVGARITVAGTVYRIREVKPDGTGAVLILLHKV